MSVIFLSACSDDEGYIKIFQCSENKPFFNVVDNHCYVSEEAARIANEAASQGSAGDGEKPSGGSVGDGEKPSGGSAGDGEKPSGGAEKTA